VTPSVVFGVRGYSSASYLSSSARFTGIGEQSRTRTNLVALLSALLSISIDTCRRSPLRNTILQKAPQFSMTT